VVVVVVVVGLVSGERLVEDGVTTGERFGSSPLEVAVAACTDVSPAAAPVLSSTVHHTVIDFSS